MLILNSFCPFIFYFILRERHLSAITRKWRFPFSVGGGRAHVKWVCSSSRLWGREIFSPHLISILVSAYRENAKITTPPRSSLTPYPGPMDRHVWYPIILVGRSQTWPPGVVTKGQSSHRKSCLCAEKVWKI